MASFSDVLKSLRIEKGLTQDALAEELNITKSAISNYENNRRSPDYETLELIADYFNVDMDYLIGRTSVKSMYLLKEFDENAPTQRLDTIDFKPKIIPVKIPILGSVPAGIPIEAIEDIIGYEEIHPDMAKRGSYFALQIKGDSMLPILQEDDIVIVKEQPDVESGDIAVIFNGDNEATVKQVKKEENGIWVIPFNTEYAFKKRFYHYEDENNSIRIVGKVVEQRRRF